MQFLNPNVFYMMLIPLLLLIVLILTSKDTLQEYFSKEMLEKLQVNNSAFSKKGRSFLLFITLILFILALSRPVINEKNHDVTQKLIPIVLALDVSKSMQAQDIYPTRLEFAKKKLKGFIKNVQNSTIGIILFAKDSFILSPVTEDFLSLNYIVDNLDTKVNFPNGSNIFATLEATKFMLEDFSVKNLLILSDGGNKQEYTKELEYAKANKIEVYVLGIGSKKGAAIPDGKGGYMTDKSGNIVTVKLNDSLKELAKKSGGGYIEYSLNESDLQAIIQRINAQSKKEKLTKQNIKTYTELFYFPLALGIFFLFLAFSSMPTFKRGKNTMVVVMLLLLSTTQSSMYAYEFDFQRIEKAKELYKEKKFDEAADKYRAIRTTPESLYNLGNSLYKEKKYDQAIDTFSKVVTNEKNLELKKLHNIGNAYVQKQNLEKAKEFYEKALKVKFDKETKENLDMVNEALDKKKKEQKEKNEDNQSKENNKQKEKQKNKDQEKQNKQNSDKKDSQEKQNKKQEQQSDKKDQAQNSMEQKQSSQEISKMEEEKWMKRLEDNNKAPILIQKAPSENKEEANDTQPW